MRRYSYGASVLALMVATTSPAWSQDAGGERPIESITVVGTNQDRYRTGETSALTGFDLDYLELPRMVEVIPEQLLLDQKATELEEALRNVPGISRSDGFGGSNNDYLIRGFRRNTIYRNGFRIASNFKVNTTNLESIRVIKGPAAITYGQVEPGGLVDVVTKKPLEEQRIYTEARGGSYNNYLFLGDWSQPIGDQAAIRINASTQDSESFRDFFTKSRDALALTGRYDFSENTRLNLSYEYRDEFRSFDRGTVTIPTPDGREIVNRVLDIPISRRFGERYEEIDTRFHFATADFRHALNDQWEVRFAAALEKSKADDLQARPVAVRIFEDDAPITADGFLTGNATPQPVFDEPTDQVFMVRHTDGSRNRERDVVYLNGRMTGEFETGSIRHRVAIGGNFRRSEEDRVFVLSPDTNGMPRDMGGTGPLFNIEDPTYGTLPSEVTIGEDPFQAFPVDGATQEHGFFVNDYINLTDRLGVLAGGRFDFVDIDDSGPAEAVSEFSPQAAVSYRVVDNVSLFGSYSEAFIPNEDFRPGAGGEPSETELFPPEDSKQYELGAKAQFFDRRLNASAAAYKIEKSNVLTTVDGMLQLVDGQQSKGLELSISGQPVPGMNVIAGYAYTDAEILTGANAGNQPTNVADHTFNLWASYEVRQGELQGLGGGAGVFYMSDRFGDNANSWNLGSYTLVDASIWYTLPASAMGKDGSVRLQLSAKNLLDKEYYPASGGDLRVTVGTPRRFFASVSTTF